MCERAVVTGPSLTATTEHAETRAAHHRIMAEDHSKRAGPPARQFGRQLNSAKFAVIGERWIPTV